MFRIIRLSIIRSLFTVHSAMVYVILVCREVSCRNRMEMQFHPGPDRKLSTNMYDIHHCWIYSELIHDDWRTKCMKHVEVIEKINFCISLALLLKNLVRFAVTLKENAYTTLVICGTMNEEGKMSVLNPFSISYVNMSSVRTINHV